jgi:hypothetical protein
MAVRLIEWVQANIGAIAVIRHGAATGIDRSFDWAAGIMRIETDPHPADWSKGRSAGPIRNSAMVKLGADIAVACHRDLAGSRGTRDCVRKCLKAGIPVYLVDGEDAEPRRITEV